MIIPNIWKHKKCSKPPTSDVLPEVHILIANLHSDAPKLLPGFAVHHAEKLQFVAGNGSTSAATPTRRLDPNLGIVQNACRSESGPI